MGVVPLYGRMNINRGSAKRSHECTEGRRREADGESPPPLSDSMYLFCSFGKSTDPQKRQINILMNKSKQ